MAQHADAREAVPGAAVISLDETITANDSATLAPAQVNHALKAHFDRAVALLEQKAELAADIAEWRRQVRADGLVPPVLLKLAREHLRDAEQRRKAAEAAEVERALSAGARAASVRLRGGQQSEHDHAASPASAGGQPKPGRRLTTPRSKPSATRFWKSGLDLILRSRRGAGATSSRNTGSARATSMSPNS